jgi:uncharacterized membrane protein YfhO
VRLQRWTPNALAYVVNTPEPTDLVINQNYDPSWKVASGTGQVFDLGALAPTRMREFSVPGLLAVHIPGGRQRIELRYRPASVIVGAAVTLITILVSMAFWFADRRKSVVEGLGKQLCRLRKYRKPGLKG